jgi:iron(III) transport system substrate-binding protein
MALQKFRGLYRKREVFELVRKILSMAFVLGFVLFVMGITVAAAAPSGSLMLYTSMPDADLEKMLNVFKEVCPSVEVEVFRSGTEEIMSKIYAEQDGGRIMADILQIADTVTFERLKEDGLLMAYRSPETAGIDPAYLDPDHMYTGTKAIFTVLVYNTQLPGPKPSDWKDMISKEAEGKVSMASPLYSGSAANMLGVLTRFPQFGWEYYEALRAAKVKVGQGNGGVITDVTRGEKKYGIVIDYMANNAKKAGNPVDFVYPASGSMVVTEPVGILAGTKNPEAAKAYVDFVLSEKGQEAAMQLGYVPVHRNVKAPEGLEPTSSTRLIAADITEMYRGKDEDKNRFSRLFE